MHFSSPKGILRLFFSRNACVIYTVLFLGLLSAPTSIFALSRLLNVEVDTVWIDESTAIRGVTASFPYSVLTRVKVYDENNHYVPRLASREQWLGLTDTTEGGQRVRDAWRTTLEYHVEDNAIPKDPNVKNDPDHFGVTEVRMYDKDLSIMLVMDYSNSMDDAGIVENAVLDLISEIGGRDALGIVKFSDEIKVCQTLTTDTLLLKAAVNDSSIIRFGTSLYSAVDTAINHLQYKNGRRVIVVYTDGKNDDSIYNLTTLQQVIDHAKAENIELFVIGLGGGIDEPVLKKLAADTEGKYYYGETSKRIEPIFLKVYGDLRGYYIMKHMSPDPFNNGTWRWVDVELIDVWKGGNGRARYYVPYYPSEVYVTKSVSADSVSLDGQKWFSMASDTVDFTVRLENRGKGAYPEIKITDVLSDSMFAVSDHMILDDRISLTSLTPHQVQWSLPRLDGGEALQIQYKAVLDPVMPIDAMPLMNQVQLEGALGFAAGTDIAEVNGYGYSDLSVHALDPGFFASPGQRVRIQAQIVNQGNAPVDRPFRVSFEYQGQILDYDTLQTLDLNDPVIVSGDVSFPALGTYQILVRADADQALREFDETNNTSVCTLTVQITALDLQISDVNYRDMIRDQRGRFPDNLLTTVHVLDQNAYPVHGLADTESWIGLSAPADNGSMAGNIWTAFQETYRDDPAQPQNPNIRPGMEITEMVGGAVSWVVLISTGGVSSGWLDMIKVPLNSLVNRMGISDRAAVMTSKESASTVQSFTGNKTLLKNAVNNLAAGNGSRFQDNLISAIDLAASGSGRNAVIAVTGSPDAGSASSADDVIAYAQSKGVPLYILNMKNQTSGPAMNALALGSGGYQWEFETRETFSAAVQNAERLLKNYYVLNHVSSDTLKNLSWRRLDLQVRAYNFEARDTGIYQAPKGIFDVFVEKRLVSESYRIENGDTLWIVQPGDSAWSTINVTNNGDFPLTQIQLRDSLASNLKAQFPSFATYYALDNRLEWTIDQLAVGESRQFRYTCFIDTLPELIEKDLVSTIRLTNAADESPGNDADHDTLRYVPLSGVDLSIRKHCISDSMAVAGTDTSWFVKPEGMITYFLSITNSGEMPARDIEVRDILPDYIRWQSTTRPFSRISGDTLIWEISQVLGHRSTISWSYTCIVDSLMPPWDVALLNSASVACAEDLTAGNNSSAIPVTAVGIAPPWPNINASPALIYPQDTVAVQVMSPFSVKLWDLKIIYGNETNSTIFADAFISATSLTPNQMIRVVPDFTDTKQRTSNQEETLRFILQTTDLWDVVRNDTAEVVIALPDVVVKKQVVSDSVQIVNGDSLWYADPGDTVQYRLTLTNRGKLPGYQLMIQDILPPDLTFIRFEPPVNYQISGDTLAWQLNSLDGLMSRIVYTYVCRVSESLPPWIQANTNRAYVSCDRDWNLSNNTAAAVLYVAGDIPPDPVVMTRPGTAEPGDSVQVRIVSPINIEPGDWNLSIVFADGSVIDDYAWDFSRNNGLPAGDTLLIRPVFTDTRMRGDGREEEFSVILETIDSWRASYFDTSDVTLRSGDAFFLNENVFHPAQNPSLGMRFRMSSNRHAKITIYDIAGGYIKTVIDGPCLAGWNQGLWEGDNRDGRQVGSGVYVAIYISGNVKKAHKFIVVR